MLLTPMMELMKVSMMIALMMITMIAPMKLT